MITTDICGRNLIAINSNCHEIVVEIAPKGLLDDIIGIQFIDKRAVVGMK